MDGIKRTNYEANIKNAFSNLCKNVYHNEITKKLIIETYFGEYEISEGCYLNNLNNGMLHIILKEMIVGDFIRNYHRKAED